MTAPRSPRSKASRRRRRRVRTRSLVFLAVAASFTLLLGRGTAQIVDRFSCSNNPVLINVAVSTDIAPAIQRVAEVFNREHRQTRGKCVAVQLTVGAPAAATAQIDGQHPGAGHPLPIDAWIPDSSLWVDEARGFAVGATNVQPAGFSVARSPLMIVMPDKAAAARTAAFGRVGWQLLLPRSAGGPVEPPGLRVDLPDPSQSAAGLATLIQISRLLGPNNTVKFTEFVKGTAVTSYFDDPASLTSFVSLAAPPLNGLPVTITTEQAVLAYDAANPRAPLAATYPAGKSAEFGTPELDYPYVLTTSSPMHYAAARVFGKMLTEPYARSVIRFAGFRSGRGAGVPDQFPVSYGLSDQLLQVAPAASATEAPTALQAWNKLALGSRDLVLIDTSLAMSKPASAANPTGPTLEQELTQTASLGLALFTDASNLGLWEFAANLRGHLPYRQLVSIGPLPANLGVISRRAELQHIAVGLKPAGGPNVALYGSILDAYTYMQKTYQPSFFNVVVVLASGVENAPGDITGPALIKKLMALANPNRKVAVIIIAFGNPPDFGILQQIAATTGGQAFAITDPSQVGKVFFQALAHRLCDPNCVGA